jgi:hypothetical protein
LNTIEQILAAIYELLKSQLLMDRCIRRAKRKEAELKAT